MAAGGSSGDGAGGPGASATAGLPPFNNGNRYDLSTFQGRCHHFLKVLDPRTLLVPTSELERCARVIDEWKQGVRHDNKELWDCREVLDAGMHPTLNTVIPAPFRMAAFTPVNIPICYGMLNAHSQGAMLFWQWFNQSYNSAVNYHNRAGGAVDVKAMVASYCLAIATSCGLAVGLGKASKTVSFLKGAPPALISYVAVASAGASNILASRQSELREGAPVTDESGNVLGTSVKAGQSVVLQTVLSRGLFIPMPVLLLPHAIMQGLARLRMVPQNPRLKLGLELSVITGSLAFALPVAMSLFPQRAAFKAADLEPQFENLKDSRGRPITTLYCNKGL